jgi:hypothetical protein
MTKEEIKTAVLHSLAQAEGYEHDELDEMRREALDYYYNRSNIAPTMPGRSAIQSSDVADMIESVVAQMMPAFESETLADFEPLSDEDVDQARTEGEAVNYVVMQLNDGHYQIQAAIKDALLLRNGFIKIYVEERVNVETETYEGLSEDEGNYLLANSIDNLNGVDSGATVTLKDTEQDIGTYDATVKVKTTTRKVKVCAVDPVNMSWAQNWNSIYLKDCPFVAERDFPRRSELVEMGYPKKLVASLPPGAMDISQGGVARNPQREAQVYEGSEPSQDLIEVYECYTRLDRDGDGVAELLKVVVAGNTVLEVEDAEYVPYASGTAFLQPHRFNGLGLFDKLRYVQDQKTFTLRQWADSQNHANNPRIMAMRGMYDHDSLEQAKPAGIAIIDSPDAIQPFPFTDVGPSCQSTLDYLDKVRSERGGASLDLITAEAQIAGDTAHGVERQMTSKEQLAAAMTRTLSETLIRTTFEMTHRALRLYQTDEMTFRSSGKFVKINPQEWPERERVVIKPGLSNAERMRRKAMLEQTVSLQMQALQSGMDGVLVTQGDLYNALLDLSQAGGLNSPDTYWTDPDSEEAQAAAQAKAQQAEQEKQFQLQMLELQKGIEDRKADNNDAKVMEDARQFDQNLQFEYWKENQANEVKEAQMITDTALKVIDGDK